MRNSIYKRIGVYLLLPGIAALAINSCTKYQKGFLSPNIQYLSGIYTMPKGRVFTSDALDSDGSSLPMNVKLLHVYDSGGRVMDSLFFKTYSVTTWKGLYDPTKDTTYGQIQALQQIEQLTPITVNQVSGVIQGNFATANLPSGTYSFDEQISNVAGSLLFKNMVKVNLIDTTDFDWAPALGTIYDHLFMVGNESVTAVAANPIVTIVHVNDSPNVIIVKMLDKNGVPFDPKTGEIAERPNTGLNPDPAYLPCLQSYTNTFSYTDSTMTFNYALTPFPFTPVIAADGYNLYYRIPTQYFSVDGFPDGKYSANPRLPFRLYVPGTYTITMQFPDLTHK